MKTLLRSVLFTAVLGTLAAASADAQSPTIGFKLGASFSTISGDDIEDVKTLSRFTGGGFMRFDMGAFGVQPELMYVTKGGKFDEFDPDLGATFTGELRLDYIEIPVLLTVPLMTGPGIAPYLYGGPAFAFEVGCTVAFSGGGFAGSASCDEGDDEFDRKKFDVGAMIGGGIAVPAGPGALLLEGRYNFGLINLNDSDEDGSARHRSGAVLLGYSIPIGQR